MKVLVQNSSYQYRPIAALLAAEATQGQALASTRPQTAGTDYYAPRYIPKGPVPYPTTAINGVMGPGQHGYDVTELQVNMKRLGYQVQVNGNFDADTAIAVLNFKQRAGLHQGHRDLFTGQMAVNSLVGPTTKSAIDKAVKALIADDNPRPTSSGVWGMIGKLFGRRETSSTQAPDITPSAPSNRLMWPVKGRVTSEFGRRIHPIHGTPIDHKGIDIAVATGTPIKAARGGVVKVARFSPAEGNYVVIDHGNGMSTLYAHNSKLLVKEGQRVAAGQVISKAGSTGWSTGPHLHFGVYVNGVPKNPRLYLR